MKLLLTNILHSFILVLTTSNEIYCKTQSEKKNHFAPANLLPRLIISFLKHTFLIQYAKHFKLKLFIISKKTKGKQLPELVNFIAIILFIYLFI